MNDERIFYHKVKIFLYAAISLGTLVQLFNIFQSK
jgi:hypothetical protein